jgi:hypothetical protein
MKNIDNTFIDESESEFTVSITDGFVPPQKEWIKYGIYETSGVLYGKFLALK